MIIFDKLILFFLFTKTKISHIIELKGDESYVN